MWVTVLSHLSLCGILFVTLTTSLVYDAYASSDIELRHTLLARTAVWSAVGATYIAAVIVYGVLVTADTDGAATQLTLPNSYKARVLRYVRRFWWLALLFVAWALVSTVSKSRPELDKMHGNLRLCVHAVLAVVVVTCIVLPDTLGASATTTTTTTATTTTTTTDAAVPRVLMGPVTNLARMSWVLLPLVMIGAVLREPQSACAVGEREPMHITHLALFLIVACGWCVLERFRNGGVGVVASVLAALVALVGAHLHNVPLAAVVVVVPYGVSWLTWCGAQASRTRRRFAMWSSGVRLALDVFIALGCILAAQPQSGGGDATLAQVAKHQPCHYAVCALEWHQHIVVRDLAFLAHAAYTCDANRTGLRDDIVTAMDTIGVRNRGWTVAHCSKDSAALALRYGTIEFRPRRDSGLKIDIVFVRGTAEAADWVLNSLVWGESLVSKLALFWDRPMTHHVVSWLLAAVRGNNSSPASTLFEHVVADVCARTVKRHKVIVTGHSLGGGVAKLVTALVMANTTCWPKAVDKTPQEPSIYAVAFNPPGTQIAAAKLGIEIAVLDEMHKRATSVVPARGDIVPLIDTDGGLKQYVPCDGNWEECHRMERMLVAFGVCNN